MHVQVESALPNEAVALATIDMQRVDIPSSSVTLLHAQDLPERIEIDTRRFDDGRYLITVQVVTQGGAVSRDAVEFVVRNGWELTDPLEAPQVFFGSVWDRSLTVRQSDGWTYATDSPQHFFGDANRKHRKDTSAQELVWEAPFLRTVHITLYSKEPSVEDTLELSVSPDGERWTELPYEVAPAGESPAGWVRLQILASVHTPDNVRFFRLLLSGASLPADALQLGEVHLEGR